MPTPVYPFVDWASLGVRSAGYPLTQARNAATPILFAALYLPPCTLSVGSQALIHLPAAGRQGELTLEDLSGTTVATWTSPVSVGPVYQPVPLAAPVVLAGGWYNIGLASLAGGSVNVHGLYLTV